MKLTKPIKYKTLDTNLNPFWGQPDPVRPVLGSWEPKIGPKIGLNLSKTIGLQGQMMFFDIISVLDEIYEKN